jgi:hypothetical protein
MSLQNNRRERKKKNREKRTILPLPPPGDRGLEEDGFQPQPQQKPARDFRWISQTKKKIFEKISTLKILQKNFEKIENLRTLEKKVTEIENPEKLEEILSKVSQKISEKTAENLEILGPAGKERLLTLKAEMDRIQNGTYFEELKLSKRLKLIDLMIDFVSIKTDEPNFPNALEKYVSEHIEETRIHRAEPIVHPDAYRATLKYQILTKWERLESFIQRSYDVSHPSRRFNFNHLRGDDLEDAWLKEFYSFTLTIPTAIRWGEEMEGTPPSDIDADLAAFAARPEFINR